MAFFFEESQELSSGWGLHPQAPTLVIQLFLIALKHTKRHPNGFKKATFL